MNMDTLQDFARYVNKIPSDLRDEICLLALCSKRFRTPFKCAEDTIDGNFMGSFDNYSDDSSSLATSEKIEPSQNSFDFDFEVDFDNSSELKNKRKRENRKVTNLPERRSERKGKSSSKLCT